MGREGGGRAKGDSLSRGAGGWRLSLELRRRSRQRLRSSCQSPPLPLSPSLLPSLSPCSQLPCTPFPPALPPLMYLPLNLSSLLFSLPPSFLQKRAPATSVCRSPSVACTRSTRSGGKCPAVCAAPRPALASRAMSQAATTPSMCAPSLPASSTLPLVVRELAASVTELTTPCGVGGRLCTCVTAQSAGSKHRRAERGEFRGAANKLLSLAACWDHVTLT